MAEIVSFNPSLGIVTVAAAPGEDLTGWTLQSYERSGNAASLLGTGSVDISDPQVSASDRSVFYYTTSFTLATENQRDAVALVDADGNLVEVVGWGNDRNFTIRDGTAAGETISNANGNFAGDNDQDWYARDPGDPWTGSNGSPDDGLPDDLIPVCFALGTLIATPEGPRRVETLQPGDLVSTRDHGPQPILWTRSGDHPLDGLARDKRPVLIRAGALGPERPATDLVVSPQHRILVGDPSQLGAIFHTEAFAPAKSLTDLPGIRHMMGKSQVTWVHFACARHEIVLSNGCWTESLLLGSMVVSRLSRDQREELGRLFPLGPRSQVWNGPPARPCLTVREARRAIAAAKSGILQLH